MDNRVPVPALLAVLAGAFFVGWVLRKVRPALPFTHRMLYVGAGGLVLGGLIYKTVLNQ